MKTWKDATIKRELERLAEGLQEIDKTIISCVRIDRSVVSDKRTVTAYSDFGKNEWLVRITFNFEINMMMIEWRGDEPQHNTITALKRSVDFALTCINATFDNFEIYYGAPYESFLPTADAEEVAEETAEQPKAKESKIEAVAQYLSNKITGWYENAKIDYGVIGKFLSCKEYGDNGIRINWEENGKEYTMVINWFAEYSAEQLYNIWMAQDVEVEEVAPSSDAEQTTTKKIKDVESFLKKAEKEFELVGLKLSYRSLSGGSYAMHAEDKKGSAVAIDFDAGFYTYTADFTLYSKTGCSVYSYANYDTEDELIRAAVEGAKRIIWKDRRTEQASKTLVVESGKDNAGDKVQEIREELKKLEELEAKTLEAEKALDADIEKTALEEAWDEAYNKEYKQYSKVARLIADLIDMDTYTARSMIMNYRDQLKKTLGL